MLKILKSCHLRALRRLLFAFALITSCLCYGQDFPAGVEDLRKFEQEHVNRDLDTRKIMVLTNHQNPEFSPEMGKTFDVRSVWLAAQQLDVFQTPELVREIGVFEREVNGRKQYLLLIHPESESFYRERISDFNKAEEGPRFKATASSSSRTLFMWNEERPSDVFFGKLSLNSEIGGVVRTILAGEIARSAGVSRILKASEGTLPARFKYFPEVLAMNPKGLESGGKILRLIPREYIGGNLRAMPLFALYTRPLAGQPSPLEIMFEQAQVKDAFAAEEFIQREILRPFVQLWADLAINHGLSIEAHAQNVLMELNSKGMPTGKFIFRDFGGFSIDLDFRNKNNLPMPEVLPTVTDVKTDYQPSEHNSALRHSLRTYFEGGFLFGLSKHLEKMGYRGLSYSDLGFLLRETVTEELRSYGIRIEQPISYSQLIDLVDRARALVPSVPGLRCQIAVRGYLRF